MDARTYRHSVPFLCTIGAQLMRSRVRQKNGNQQSSIFAPRNSGSSARFMRNPEKYDTIGTVKSSSCSHALDMCTASRRAMMRVSSAVGSFA